MLYDQWQCYLENSVVLSAEIYKGMQRNVLEDKNVNIWSKYVTESSTDDILYIIQMW
jgi:hypothetical protein